MRYKFSMVLTKKKEMSEKLILIHNAIKKNPAIRFNEIKEVTGLQNGTISHNLTKLVKLSKITTYEHRDISYYFAAGVEQKDMAILRFLRMTTPRRIIMSLVGGKSMTVTELAKTVQKSLGTVSIYKDQLFQEQVIKKEIGDRINYKLKDPRLIKLLINEYRKDLVDDMAANINDVMGSL